MVATTDRNSPAHYLQREQRFDLDALAVIPAGVMVCLDADGDAVNAANTATLSSVKGRSAHAADGTDGDTEVIVDRGVFAFIGSAALIALGRAMIGKIVYVVDNNTVGLASDCSARVRAGKLEDIDGTAFYVSCGLDAVDAVDGARVATMADAAISPAVAPSSPLVALNFPIPDMASGDIDFIVPDKIQIVDIIATKEGAGAANTIQALNGAGTAISNAIVFAVDDTATHASTLANATKTLAAGATLRFAVVRAAGTSVGEVTVLAIRRV